ncbi:MAG: [protein-PII] uridylyltransferase [Geminicoccaceae bacterium]
MASEVRKPDLHGLRTGLMRPPAADEASAHGIFLRMREALDSGRAQIREQFEHDGDAAAVHRNGAVLMDTLLHSAMEFATRHIFRISNLTLGEEFSLVAVGGYGRGELAPGSDIDLLFLYPYKITPHLEQMNEFLLYKLWDLGLKVGQSTRSVDDCIRFARDDLTVETSLLEARLVWGSQRLFDDLRQRYREELVEGREKTFIDAKLAERDARHERVGDSRYYLEPNIKEGKGGLRDLQTLIWIGRFLHDIGDPADLVAHGLLTSRALSTFRRARRFLWGVRCQLHYLTGRAEERLTFDLQPEIAERMGYRDRARTLGVERFMKHYYLVARDVGMITRIFCAALEEQYKRRPGFSLRRFGFGRQLIDGFEVIGGRLTPADPALFENEPIRMIELFRLAQARNLDIHPLALTSIAQNLRRIDRPLRESGEANRLFIEILSDPGGSAITLTRMNESGVLGRFIPDFRRIIALMQHNLYHVFTVDEHTIRAIAILHQIEKGEIADEVPLATRLLPRVQLRTELHVAVLLHDLGKGRGGDHSEIGARIARRLCPRLGLSESSTETVEWLVRHHLFMSGYAFKRDLEDPKTIQDFVAIVQSPERLRLLLILTVADIRAVGPNVWNGWKGQLLRELYHEAEAAMSSGDPSGRRQQRVERARELLRERLLAQGWDEDAIALNEARHDPRYFLGMTTDAQVRHAVTIRSAEEKEQKLAIDFHVDSFRARTELTIYTPDHPGLFMKVAGALALSGVSIVDAHIFTTTDGMALDMLGCQDAERRAAVEDSGRLQRIRRNVERALTGETPLEKELSGRRSLPARTEVFQVTPQVLLDNQASRTHTIIEVNGRDRPGLLFDLSKALKELGLVIHSAHISTYGERVVDVFYVKDIFGMKVMHKGKQRRVRERFLSALEPGT